MRSLNTYNYCEQVYMKPISYNVTISDDDKVIQIEEDGDLKAELSFEINKNTLFLNGKDGIEVAQIELPLAMSDITSQKYDADNKCIDLTVMQTNGEEITFSLDVAELVNVYTAGDGIDINGENVISIKIKDDSGTLTVDEDGLDIDTKELAKKEDIEDINSKIGNLEGIDTTLTLEIVGLHAKDKEIEDKIGNLEQGDKTITDDLEDLHNKDSELDSKIENNKNSIITLNTLVGKVSNILKDKIEEETATREAKDNEIDAKIGNLEEGGKSVAGEIASLHSKDDEIDAVLESKANQENLNALNTLVGKVSNILKDKIEEETATRESKDNEIDAKIGNLEEGGKSVADEIASLHSKDNEIDAKIGNLEEGGKSVADEIASLHSKDDEIDAKIGNLEEGGKSVADEIASLHSKDDEIDAVLESKANQENLNALNTLVGKVSNILKDKIEEETATRESKDNEIDAKIGNLEEGGKSVADEIASLHSKDDEIDAVLESKANQENLNALNTLVGKVSNILKDKIEEEAATREAKDNELVNSISIEKKDREDADNRLKEELNNNCENLIDSINLTKDTENNLHYILMVNNINKGEINIPEDKMLEKVDYDYVKKEFTFTWNSASQQEPTVVSVKDLVDTYEAANGITLDRNIFKIELNNSKYIELNQKGQLELALKTVKPQYTKWQFVLNDKNGRNNGNIIDFSEDVKSLEQSVSDTYVTIKKHNEDINNTKSEVIGSQEDLNDANTIYGVRAEIKKSEERTDEKVSNAKNESINESKKYSDNNNEKYLEISKNYSNEQVKAHKDECDKNFESLNAKDIEFGELISKNSTDINQLSTGLGFPEYTGGTGVFDDIYRLFHDITHTYDENNMKGLIRGIDNRLAENENTVSTLSGDKETSGSVAQLIESALISAKKYSDEAKIQAVNEAKEYVDAEIIKVKEEFNKVINDIKTKYSTQEFVVKSISDYSYNKETVDAKLEKKLNVEDAANLYQTKPMEGKSFLTEIPKEYITETEILTYNYATKDELQRETSDKLTRNSADSLYQVKGEYLVNSDLNPYATQAFVHTQTVDMETKTNAKRTYQPIGNYLTVVPPEYVTDDKLLAKNYLTMDKLEAKHYATKIELNNATKDMETRTHANETYQVKGNYVTDFDLQKELTSNLGITNGNIEKCKTECKSYTDNEIINTRKDLVTTSSLENKKYVTDDTLSKQNFVNSTTLNSTLRDYATNQSVESNYAKKSYVDETFAKKNETYVKSDVDGTFAKINWVESNFEKKGNVNNL